MSIESKPYYWLMCDGCGRSSTEGSEHSAWDDPGYAAEAAEDSDWQIKDDRHYCPDCPPDWCLECDADITEDNPRCGDDVWSCASCHTDCGHRRTTP